MSIRSVLHIPHPVLAPSDSTRARRADLVEVACAWRPADPQPSVPEVRNASMPI